MVIENRSRAINNPASKRKQLTVDLNGYENDNNLWRAYHRIMKHWKTYTTIRTWIEIFINKILRKQLMQQTTLLAVTHNTTTATKMHVQCSVNRKTKHLQNWNETNTDNVYCTKHSQYFGMFSIHNILVESLATLNDFLLICNLNFSCKDSFRLLWNSQCLFLGNSM